MALRVKDAIKVKAFRSLQCEAGEGGLSRYVLTACILDYECVEGNDRLPTPLFDESSFVISSLLFAKDEPSQIRPALERLYEIGVSAFAYKRVFFDQLPQDALDFANAHDFPVFSFGIDDYFENIIFEIMDAVQQDDARVLTESRIAYFLQNEVPAAEAAVLKQNLSLPFKNYAAAAYCKALPGQPTIDVNRIIHGFYHSIAIKEKVMLGNYDGGIFIIMTSATDRPDAFRLIFREYLESSGLIPEAIAACFSQVHRAQDQLPLCLRESFWTWKAVVAETAVSSLQKQADRRNVPLTATFAQIGTWQFLTPFSDTAMLQDYADRYLAPLFEKENLLETAEVWVHFGGDLTRVADALSCHQNTIRYRLSHIKELIEPQNALNLTDYQLYERLATALRIRWLQNA